MRLAVLPPRSDVASANMATDFLLLKRFPDPRAARFRAYGWRRPAVTFGYSPKIAWVRAQLPGLIGDDRVELCRRPSGGGVVDHRADWTYALVIPRGHDLEGVRAAESYRAVHAALARALVACGQPALLKESCERAPAADDDLASCAAAAGPTLCFARPELYDVLAAASGAKIAGAAQKRTKEGLLFQGSVARAAAPAIQDWDGWGEIFAAELARVLSAEATPIPWPDEFAEGVDALAETYAQPEWTEAR
jgi:lipoyl(octanoyl) transferase